MPLPDRNVRLSSGHRHCQRQLLETRSRRHDLVRSAVQLPLQGRSFLLPSLEEWNDYLERYAPIVKLMRHLRGSFGA
jgi:hypothetical protein